MSMMVNPFRFGSAPPPPVGVNWSPEYDDITGASVVGAWGLRKLVSTYTGAVVRIRDTTGGAEQDVGLGADGWLAAFTVTGNAAVVTLYDQTGNGNHLTQSDTTKQPLLVRPGVSFSGRPAIKFDGSNDFLHDATTGTTKAYMVSYPIIALEAAGVGAGGGNWAPWASVPHQAGVNSSPYYRWSIQRYNTTANLEIRLSGASSYSASAARELAAGTAIATLFVCAYADKLIDGMVSGTGPAPSSLAITYPNATGLRLGANGAGAEVINGEITALVVLSDSVASEATIQSWHDNVHHKSLAKVDDKVLDISFASDPPTDTSDRAHPVWLSNGATVSSSRLDPSSAGAAVVATSGLLIPSGNYTFEVDIYLTSLATNRRIASKGWGTVIGWHLSTHDVNNDEIMLIAGNQYIVTGEHGSQANLTTGAWHTVRFTRSGDLWKIYVNGVERASRTVTPSNAVYTARPLLIGNVNERNQAFPGYIRNVKAWSGVALVP